MTHDLDGTYLVTTTTSDQTAQKSDGQTVIENGNTCRHDEHGCKWTSTFEIIDESAVKMTSIADPSEANPDFFLTQPDGTPTRAPLSYESTLKLSRKGDKIQMSGQVSHAGETVFISMRKTQP